MRIIKQFAFLTVATVLTATSALADDHFDKYIEIMGTVSSHDRDRIVDEGLAGGSARVGGAYNDLWNIEGALSFLDQGADADKGGTADLEQISIGLNALAVFNRNGQFQPYFLLGLGGVDSDITGVDDEFNLYYDLGVGAFIPVFNDNARLRGEIVRRAEDDDWNSKDYLLHLGIGFPFGKKAAPVVAAAAVVAAPSDSDGDGVIDERDRCPNTPAGASVDANGCELDSDGDGVVDSKDQCPGTPAGTEVDEVGCAAVTVINLEGVNFSSNSADLLDGAEERLDEQAAKLAANPDITIEVAGHTDSDGDAGYNQTLSKRRADTVRAYLIGKGVGADRITSAGYGESEPVAPNDTAVGKASNRRVELRIRDK
ncbi:MAG: OmpA family protein [Gammaproteobacteria bacterium]|nr:OmpA family protein [Gammaproteobacteria bacterium]NND55312.1 OmpA family protein [Gammaproteobacteria bacterium]